MPKIPTFTSQARPTAQVGSVKSNLQIPLSQTVAGALSPVTDFVVKKAVQANDTQNRTEALRLGNGNIYTFNNYKIYLIPGNKLKLGISPLIDQFINKELDLSIHCKTGVGDIITNKYMKY